MKKNRTIFLTLLLQVTQLLLTGCAPEMAGATTETTNGIVGVVYNSDKTKAKGAIVKMLSSEYNPMVDSAPGADFTDTTDTCGRYQFNHIASGKYTILARNRVAVTSHLRKDVFVNKDSLVTIPSDTLNRSGSITAAFSTSDIGTGGYVYIPGTDIVAPVAGNGSVVLTDVPSGIIGTVLLVNKDNEQRNMLRNEITVVADDTTTIEMPLWKYRQSLVLNTAPTGANVLGNVYNFPILVRLDSSNFDFTQSRASGEDLKFIGSSNTTLHREIERWDAAAQFAEVWVLVDTVYGSNSLQSITMYWGNPEAKIVSDAGRVFDSSAGYLGVWHLNGNGKDASTRKNNAVVCTPTDADGIIGLGKKFNGTDSIKIASLLGEPQVVTLSAWVMLDTVLPGSKGAEIVSIGDGCLLRMDDTQEDYFGVVGSYHLTGETSFYHVYSGKHLRNTGWHHCAVVFDRINRTQSLYIDGMLSSSTSGTDSISYTGVGLNTVIGIHGNGKTDYNFIGTIDEVRIKSTALEADRIKLEFMNQKSKDALVVFDK